MFVTGPAGADKITVIDVAQQICCEFYKSVGIIWGDKTVLFTAIAGCAAAQFGKVTLQVHHISTQNQKIFPLHCFIHWSK